ncbi:MAG: three-Cys-motif partner protein TcmP, partial [Acidimicrobiia bacterium]|nr:three-Cys-motif partner protein TcmP [Acidimicrobiia bacterium]
PEASATSPTTGSESSLQPDKNPATLNPSQKSEPDVPAQTRRATYIDPFAGPQTNRSDQAWTAQLVLLSEPKWFRNFFLFDESPDQITRLHQLSSEHEDRNVRIHQGNSNLVLPSILPVGSIREREATFCLLDQRTFECEWQLCQHIAQLRPGATKVEQFYFLANSWLPRSLKGTSTPEGEQRIVAWLGNEDWRSFARLGSFERAETFVAKFKNELGNRSVQAWPIYQRERDEGKLMYYMIHATDHPEAPKLMARAYAQTVKPPPSVDQLAFGFNGSGS